MNKENYIVLSKIIAAVETGGQVYGKGKYDDYTAPYTNTPNEHTITLGWSQNYGYEAKKLIQMIFEMDKTLFRKLDTCSPSIEQMLSKDWVAIRWNPNSVQKNVLIKLISSDVGRACQDELFGELMNKFVSDCESSYTSNIKAVMMYCEIRHLGGKTAADRIFMRCNGDYSLDSIMLALKKDQYDESSSNQVGDSKFWSRHQKCYEFISKYAVDESGRDEIMASALSRAKLLLRQPQSETMTGYTPDGKSYFVSAGAFTNKPKKGYVIYFYSTSKGRVGHVGIVEKVDTANKIVHTIEGNTSSTEYAENGGCVARHQYSYASQGGTNRVNGFGIPNFEGAGVTADEFIAAAQSYLGYLEKASNSQLDSKKANAGSNNYQKFQRDVGAGNGDQWCQYFVDAMALYTCQGTKYGDDTPDYLAYGDSGEAVAVMQKMLIVCGYSCGSYGADGDFGSATLDALKAFQKDSKLTVNGAYDASTRVALETAYAKKQIPNPQTKIKHLTAAKVMTAKMQEVTDLGRKLNWTYGDSHSMIPCADGKCSCDRSIARALYNMGFHDQRQGGETCGTLDDYLTSHGWEKVKKKVNIKPGAVVAVRRKSHNYIDHVFYIVSYNKIKDVCTKYDTGSTERIRGKQPFKNVPLIEWADRVFVCAWNPPVWLCTGTVGRFVRDGIDYSPVFNALYYSNIYPDLAKAFGTNRKKLFEHFLKNGMREGRQGCANFEVYAYRDQNPDLKKLYKNDLQQYYMHYCTCGNDAKNRN